jgi:O-antigen/teichoic acid export membrane protein
VSTRTDESPHTGLDTSRSRPRTFEGGLGGKTVGGALWGAAQVCASKGLQMAGTLVGAYFVTEEDFGSAGVATSVALFVAVVSPVAVGDFLVQQHPLSRGLLQRAQFVGVIASIISGSVLISLAISAWLLGHSPTLAVSLAVVSIRPLADTLYCIPQAALRQELRFKQIASIDIVALALGTATSIAMAVSGLGAASLIAPLALASFVRAAAYRNLIDRQCPRESEQDRSVGCSLGRGFAVMAAAQYVHMLVNVVDWPIVWLFRSASDAGVYYFAWNLSIQANSVISSQFAQTLQPVLVLLRSDQPRQTQGFLRSLRALAAVAVPLAVLQAAIAKPVFHLLFGDRWDAAVGGFVALSVGQAFAFSIGPVLAYLKAEGRIGLLVKLQLAQLLFSVSIISAAVFLSQGEFTQGSAIFAIASASALQSVIFCPLSVIVILRGRGTTAGEVLRIFLLPLIAAVGPGVGARIAADAVDVAGPLVQIVGCLGITVCYFGLYALTLRAVDRKAASEVMVVVRAAFQRVRLILGSRR